jgi:hypothetical protein
MGRLSLKVKHFILQQLSFVAILSLLLMTGACQEPVTKKPAPAKALYFDVPGFIQTQVKLLEKENPVARKSVVENQQALEAKTLHNLRWQKELAAFAELDLNKPAFRNAFTITRHPDTAGGITETYRKKPGAEGNIELFAVTMGPDHQVRALQATRKNENPLISTSQHLELTCGNKTGHSRIQAFKISGRQKPLIFDSLQYLIITEIQ